MHHCDQTMAAYLLDWQAKLGLNIRYQRWSARYTDPAAFRREIELLGPIAGTADECRLPYRDGVQTVEGLWASANRSPSFARRSRFAVGALASGL